jgi:phosphatidylglycerophosphate synthase
MMMAKPITITGSITIARLMIACILVFLLVASGFVVVVACAVVSDLLQ